MPASRQTSVLNNSKIDRIGRKIDRGGTVANSYLHLLNIATLQQLCESRNLHVVPTGKRPAMKITKRDYVFAIQEHSKSKRPEARGPRVGPNLGIPIVAPSENDEVKTRGETTRERGKNPNNTGAPVHNPANNIQDSDAIMTDVNQSKPHNQGLLKIRLFERAKDWTAIADVEQAIERCGGLDLGLLERRLQRRIWIISPLTYRPFYEYTPGYLSRDDIEQLLHDDYIRVVAKDN
ncbi:hypothetical protein NP233_g766 [Leucocoprinus birnbaumii]|uniref:Uncharacterized protein n=1 Tax=Leucocoprinus birnbaumii TaxID=56174 RepID=A0AAD5Z021_9AGAR|nr:hypothetical protein NP233_g766 [Leucocoprinus birnbaumii]